MNQESDLKKIINLDKARKKSSKSINLIKNMIWFAKLTCSPFNSSGKIGSLKALDVDSSDNLTEDMLSKFLARYLSIYLSIYVSIYLCMYLSIYPSIYLSIYLFLLHSQTTSRIPYILDFWRFNKTF